MSRFSPAVGSVATPKDKPARFNCRRNEPERRGGTHHDATANANTDIPSPPHCPLRWVAGSVLQNRGPCLFSPRYCNIICNERSSSSRACPGPGQSPGHRADPRHHGRRHCPDLSPTSVPGRVALFASRGDSTRPPMRTSQRTTASWRQARHCRMESSVSYPRCNSIASPPRHHTRSG